MARNIGEIFQKETKYDREKMPAGSLDWDKKPDSYKEYPDAITVKLERPKKCGDMSLHEALLRRKSLRRYLDVPVSSDALSCLVWASSGIQRKEMGLEFRTTPSAGALYPIETYLVVNEVEHIEQGIYHYNVKDHVLEELKRGNSSDVTAQASLGQMMCAKAAVVIIWTAVFERSRWKYQQRAYRYVYLEAGQMAQNLALASTSLGLGCCQVGAFFDNEVNQIIGVDGTNESVVYMSVIGQTGMYV
jgi:SagB-type dehydrogenase family enzyme